MGVGMALEREWMMGKGRSNPAASPCYLRWSNPYTVISIALYVRQRGYALAWPR